MRRLITYTLYALVILIPLTFTDINSELFEFPKFILLLSATLIIAVTWILHSYLQHDFSLFPKDSGKSSQLIHYSILAILLTQAIATLFSIHPYTSFWGYYSRFHQGLLTTICYTVIYFAAVKWLDTKSTQKLIKISVRTAIFIGLIAVFEHFNYSLTCVLMSGLAHMKNASDHIIKNTSCWGANTNPLNRSFATIGQPNWLAAYLIPHIFLIFYLYQTDKNKNIWKKISTIVSFSALFAALLFTKSRSGLLAFALSFLVYALLILRTYGWGKIKSSLLWTVGFLGLICLIFGTPVSPSLKSFYTHETTPAIETAGGVGTALETGGTESGTIRKIVWTGALKLIEQHPLFGTGPETFGYTYYWTRPISHNYTSEWDFLYNKAHNEYLNIAAGAGLIGLFAYLLWHFAICQISLTTIPKSKKVRDDENDYLRALYPVLAASIVGFFVTNFFGFSVIPVYLIMTLVSVLPTTLAKKEVVDEPTTISHYVIIFIASVTLIIALPIKLFSADYFYTYGKAALDAGRPGAAIPLLNEAINDRPTEDLFISSLSESYALLATASFTATNSAVKAETSTYISQALALADKTRIHNPWQLNYFKSRAKVFLTLATIDPKYNQGAADELEGARKLAPTDPKLAYNLGLVYTRLGRGADAVAQLQDAINLKKDYADPYYALTLLYEQTKQTDKIIPLLKDAKTNLATYSAQLRDKITKYVK